MEKYSPFLDRICKLNALFLNYFISEDLMKNLRYIFGLIDYDTNSQFESVYDKLIPCRAAVKLTVFQRTYLQPTRKEVKLLY